jgi:hypothetical protein
MVTRMRAPGVEHSRRLGHRFAGVGEGDHRRRVEPAVAPVEAPVLVEPGVEGRERSVEGGDVAPQRLLHPDPQGGEQQRAIQTLLVEEGHPGVAVAIAGVAIDGIQLAEHRLEVEPVVVAAPEVVLEAARPGDRVEGGVGDELVDLPAHQQPALTADVGPLHAPLGHRGVDVAGERVGGLVVVVVGVERPERQIDHAGMVAVPVTGVSGTVRP